MTQASLKSWLRIQACIEDFVSALCGFWPDNGSDFYRMMREATK